MRWDYFADWDPYVFYPLFIAAIGAFFAAATVVAEWWEGRKKPPRGWWR